MRDFLAWDGGMGAMPDWYPYYLAAEHLHVPPWVLMGMDYCWTDWALRKMEAEASARAIRRQIDNL